MADLPSERAILDALRRQYEARGYSFLEYPTGTLLPPFVHGREVDAIAVGSGENVAIEVKPRRGTIAIEQSQQMAELFRNQPGWRFVVVYADDVQREVQSQADALKEAVVLVAESKQLLAQSFVRAALLTAWSAVEAASRAKVLSDPIAGSSPSRVVDSLVEAGTIDEAKAKAMHEALQLRNRAAHGFPAAITESDVSALIDAAQAIVDRPASA